MKKLGLLFLTCLLVSIPAHAAKVTTGTYHTKESSDKVYSDLLKVLVQQRYAVKFTDKAQGTIQANKTGPWDGAEYATVFINVNKEENQTSVEATFTKRSGFVGGGSPSKWAATLGDDLKKELPDLTADIKKK